MTNDFVILTSGHPPSCREVLRTPYGRWVWWPGLGLIDYTPIGKRRFTETIGLRKDKDNLTDAIRFAARAEAGRKPNKE